MTDPNATAVDGGAEEVRKEFDRKSAAFGSLKDFIFQSDASIVPPPMLVDGILPFDGIAFIGGQWGAGKTFIHIDLTLALTTGTQFFGRDVHDRVGVALVAAEGRALIPARIEAARRERAPDKKELPIAWCGDIPALKTSDDIKRFATRLRLLDGYFHQKYLVRLGAVVFDTIAATLELEDEDDNSEAARTMRKLRDLAGLVSTRDKDGHAVNPLIIPIHHYGKSVATGLRGGSGWGAGGDVVISVLADRDYITGEAKNRRLVLTKARDGVEGPIAPFDLRFVQLGLRRDGTPFGSMVVEPMLGHSGPGDIGAKAAGAAPKENRGTRVFREAFMEALDTSGKDIQVMGTGPWVRAVLVEGVRIQFDRRYATGEREKRTEAARKAFGRVLKALPSQFATGVEHGEEFIWLVK